MVTFSVTQLVNVAELNHPFADLLFAFVFDRILPKASGSADMIPSALVRQLADKVTQGRSNASDSLPYRLIEYAADVEKVPLLDDKECPIELIADFCTQNDEYFGYALQLVKPNFPFTHKLIKKTSLEKILVNQNRILTLISQN